MIIKLISFCFLLFSPFVSAQTLIISDSHGVGAYGSELIRLHEIKGMKISLYAFGGTRPVDWIDGNNLKWGFLEHHTGKIDRRGTNTPTPKLVELIKVLKPKMVIISLGTNIVWRDEEEEDRSQIQFLISSILKTNAKCVWVGPPHLNVTNPIHLQTIEKFHQLLKAEVTKTDCQLIESHQFTHYPDNVGDGVHYDKIPNIGSTLARQWAKDVFYLIRF